MFRKGEAYAQLLFVPHDARYRLTPMTPEAESRRRELEYNIAQTKSRIADNEWHNPAGDEFDNHYKLLARAYAQGGLEAVESIVRKATLEREQSLANDKPVAECLKIALEHLKAWRYAEARDLYFAVLRREPTNAEACFRLGVIAASTSVPELALKMMSRAVQFEPSSPAYQANLGELLRRLNRLGEAEACFRASLRLDPRQPGIVSAQGLTLAQQGRVSQGLEMCRAAVAAAPGVALIQYRLGQVLAIQRQFANARAAYERALAIDPALDDARKALAQIPP